MNLIYFLLGAVFILVGIPTLQSISDVFQSLLQWFVSYCNVHIADYNGTVNQIQKQPQQQQEETKTNAVGFQVPNEEEYEGDGEGE